MNKVFAYKTTITGILTALGAVIAVITSFINTGTVSTEVLMIALSAIAAAFTGIFARDYNSTSENEGLK